MESCDSSLLPFGRVAPKQALCRFGRSRVGRPGMPTDAECAKLRAHAGVSLTAASCSGCQGGGMRRPHHRRGSIAVGVRSSRSIEPRLGPCESNSNGQQWARHRGEVEVKSSGSRTSGTKPFGLGLGRTGSRGLSEGRDSVGRIGARRAPPASHKHNQRGQTRLSPSLGPCRPTTTPTSRSRGRGARCSSRSPACAAPFRCSRSRTSVRR